MKLSRREKVLLSMLIWAVSLYIFYYYLYAPLNQKATVLVNQNKNYRKQLLTVQKLDHKQNSINSRYLRYRMELANTSALIPDSPYIPEIIAFMEKVSQSSNTQLMTVDYKDQVQGEVPETLPKTGTIAPDSLYFDLNVTGNYYDLVTFLKSIEKAPRLYNLNRVKLTALPKKEEPVANSNGMGWESASLLLSPELTGAARYDGDNLLMNINLYTYYYSKSIKSSEIKQDITPIRTKRDNPFNY